MAYRYTSCSCNFSKSIGGGGGLSGRSAQGAIKVLMESDFSSNFTPFIANIGEAQSDMGGGGSGPPKENRDTYLQSYASITARGSCGSRITDFI